MEKGTLSPSFEGHSVASISVCYVSGCHGLPLCSLKFWTTFTKVLQHSNSALEPHGCMNRAAVVQAASAWGQVVAKVENPSPTEQFPMRERELEQFGMLHRWILSPKSRRDALVAGSPQARLFD